MAPTDSKNLFSTVTGGFSLLKMLLLVAGLVLLILQGLALAGGLPEDGFRLSLIMPGLVAALLLVMALLFVGKKGHSTLHTDRLQGKTSSNRSYDLPLENIGSVDLMERGLVVRDAAGAILVRDGVCQNRFFQGLLWLRLQYKSIPEAVWARMREGSSAEFPHALRFFANAEGNTDFFDAGLMLTLAGTHYYLPAHDTLRTVKAIRGDLGLANVNKAEASMVKFEPDPSMIPVFAFVSAVHASAAAGFDAPAFLRDFVLKHGGCALEAGEAGIWHGECEGWAVRVETER